MAQAIDSTVVKFLQQAHPGRNPGAEELLACSNLYTDGWLDSLLQLRLLAFLENEFKIYIPAYQISPAGFQNVAAICTLVKKLQNAGPIA